MSRFKKAMFMLVCILGTISVFSQVPDAVDTLPVSDTTSQLTDQTFDEDTDFPGSPGHDGPAVRSQLPDTITFRKVADSISSRLKKQKEFEYANDPEYWIKKPVKRSDTSISIWQRLAEFFARPAVQSFITLLLFGLVIFFIIKVIIVNNLYIFRSSPKKKKANASADEASLMEENLDDLISDALIRKDDRAAVRFHYLKTLKLLDKKGWINFHPQSTNESYRKQVNNYAKGKEFGFLSSAYEHVWYGNFQLSADQFEIVLHNFNHFQNSLKV